MIAIILHVQLSCSIPSFREIRTPPPPPTVVQLILKFVFHLPLFLTKDLPEFSKLVGFFLVLEESFMEFCQLRVIPSTSNICRITTVFYRLTPLQTLNGPDVCKM